MNPALFNADAYAVNRLPIPAIQPPTVGGALLDWFTGNDAEIARGAELDARLKALNTALAEKGKISAAQAAQANARIDADGAATYSAQVEAGFYDGMTDGYRTMADAVLTVEKVTVDSVKSALNVPVNAFKSALATAGTVAQVMVIGQWVLAGLAVYVVYRALKSNTGRRVAKTAILKRI